MANIAVIEYNGYHEMTVSNVVETLKLMGHTPIVYNNSLPLGFRRSDIKVEWKRIEEYKESDVQCAILTTVDNAPTHKIHRNMFAIHHNPSVIETEYKQIRTHPKFEEFYFPMWMGNISETPEDLYLFDYVIQGNTESFRRNYQKLEAWIESEYHMEFLIIGQEIESIRWKHKYENLTCKFYPTSDMFYKMIRLSRSIASCIENPIYINEIVSSSLFLAIGMKKNIVAIPEIIDAFSITSPGPTKLRYLNNNMKVINENLNL